MDRRRFVQTGLGAGAAAALSLPLAACAGGAGEAGAETAAAGGPAEPQTAKFKQSVTRWPFEKMSLDDLSTMAKELGIASVELLGPDEWAVAKRHGLACAMGYVTVPDPSTRLTKGWNDPANHAWMVPAYERGVAQAAEAGVPNVICFSGNRAGLTDEAGLANCAAGLAKVMPAAERAGVTVCMELLNSKVDHADYQCDHTAWGVALAEKIGSPRFKLLYDIYHMQIMEGDVIRTIQTHHKHIGHYHTAGVPGRHELDATQELQYPAIMRAIAGTGFTGYVAQEFIPTRDPRASLAEAVRLCRV